MKAIGKAPPVIASTEAYAKLQAAATHAGLTIEELADLVVDSGVSALPPSDGVSRRFTLEELGARLWSEMQTRPRSKRAEWFDLLMPIQQRAVIVTLRDRGFSSQVIAQEFDLTPMHVARTWNEHADELGSQVVGLRLNTIAGQMQLVYERAMDIESGKGNGRAMWAMEKERIAVLQSLGIIDSAVHKSEVTHKLDDVARDEIAKLVQLEQKRALQLENSQIIDAEVFDVMPESIQTFHEDP